MKNRTEITWEPETEFALSPRITSESGLRRFSRACLEKLQNLREKIVAEMAFKFAGSLSLATIRRAVNEADAIAGSLPYPSLILPTLAEEKVQELSRWQAKQRLIQSRGWMKAA